jgi:predicted HicB family RNase H-like nuclease
MTTKPRPRLDATVVARVSTKQFDATYAQARAERQTMSQWIRRVLQAAISGRPPYNKS